MGMMIGRAWRRLFGCRICRGSGVVFSPGCDCGSNSLYPHEAYCSTSWCPNRCDVVGTADEAHRIWSIYERHGRERRQMRRLYRQWKQQQARTP